MQYKDVINNIIPADDLHWDGEEKRYVSISPEETQEIIEACLKSGITELPEVYKFVQWCGYIRVGEILIKNFLAGSLTVSGFDEHDSPYFKPNKENGQWKN